MPSSNEGDKGLPNQVGGVSAGRPSSRESEPIGILASPRLQPEVALQPDFPLARLQRVHEAKELIHHHFAVAIEQRGR
jgi:hypothetical protein